MNQGAGFRSVEPQHRPRDPFEVSGQPINVAPMRVHPARRADGRANTESSEQCPRGERAAALALALPLRKRAFAAG